MNRRYFIIIFCLFVACTKEELKEGSQVLEVNVHNELITFRGDEFGGNENCEMFFINSSAVKDKFKRWFRLKIAITTEGRIQDIIFFDYSDANRHYRAPEFIPSEVFLIENFSFDQVARSLSFEFSGTLYEVDKPQNTLPISGKVRMNNLLNVSCSYSPWLMKADINDIPFQKVRMLGFSDAEKAEWFAFSDEGTKILLTTTQDLRDMPVGSYPFTKDDLLNNISIEKYIGPYKANSKIADPDDWQTYQCEGEFVIEEQIKSPERRTKGHFNFKAFENNKLVYTVRNGEFGM